IFLLLLLFLHTGGRSESAHEFLSTTSKEPRPPGHQDPAVFVSQAGRKEPGGVWQNDFLTDTERKD
ncbi:hypothetical protein, partial [Duodenibacillus massiliensis]|uniref:hypothetical protein n=1 Tax=Duodenibacillus massiliensis TaxID=1852381 RepID=UPI003AB6AA80